MAEDELAGTEVSSPEEEAIEPVELPFEERLLQRLDGLEHSLRTVDARVNGIHSIGDRNTAQITQLHAAFTEEFGATKKAVGLFEKFIRESQGDAAYQQWEQQQELEAYREKEKAPKPPPDEPRAVQRGLAQERDDAFFLSIVPELHEYAQDRGLNVDMNGFAALFGNKFKTLEWGEPTETDTLGQRKLVKAAKEVVRAEVDRLRAAGKPRATIAEASRGASAPTDKAAEYLKILRDGGKLPTAAEIDALTAHYARM